MWLPWQRSGCSLDGPLDYTNACTLAVIPTASQPGEYHPALTVSPLPMKMSGWMLLSRVTIYKGVPYPTRLKLEVQ